MSRGAEIPQGALDSDQPYLDLIPWARRMVDLSQALCRITIRHRALGSGFLIGPDLVLTNYHVIKSLVPIAGVESDPPEVLQCQFTQNRTGDHLREVSLAEDCFVAKNAELDFAIVRLSTAIGSEPVDGTQRGWVSAPDFTHAFKPATPLLILQFPLGGPLRMAIATDGVIGVDGGRVRHKVNTDHGSSGSPCFDIHLQLVALHRAMLKDRSANLAIRLRDIRDALSEQERRVVQWRAAPEGVVQPRYDDVLVLGSALQTAGNLESLASELSVPTQGLGSADVAFQVIAQAVQQERVQQLVASAEPKRQPDSRRPGFAPPPLPKPSFVGRTAELAKLHAALVPWSRSDGDEVRPAGALAVVGTGGIGKTQLVLRFAFLSAADFPGGILWTPARPEGRTLEAQRRWVLERWMVALAPEERGLQELGEAELHARLTDASAVHVDRHGATLVLIDSVDDRLLLETLLQAVPRCAVLVTARPNVDLPKDLPQFPLEGLSVEDRKRLVQERQRDPELDRLFALVEGHALAVDLLAHEISQGKRTTELLAGLSTKLNGLALEARVTAVIDRAVEALPQDGSLPFLTASASFSTSGFGREAAAFVAGMRRAEEAQAVIDRLVTRSLVEPIEIGDATLYRLHDLIRDHLRKRQDRGWEIASLPEWLWRWRRARPAGQAAYDLRHETFYLRKAEGLHSAGPLPAEVVGNLTLAIARRAGQRQRDDLQVRLALVSQFLAGADLSKVTLQRVVLDEAVLDGAKLVEANLSGSPVRVLPALDRATLRDLAGPLLRVVVATVLVLLASMLERLGFEGTFLRALQLLVAGGELVRFGVVLLLRGGRWSDHRILRSYRSQLVVLGFTALGTGASIGIAARLVAVPLGELVLLAVPYLVVSSAIDLGKTLGLGLLPALVRRGWGSLARALVLRGIQFILLVLVPVVVAARLNSWPPESPYYRAVATLVVLLVLVAIVGFFASFSSLEVRGRTLATTYLRRASLRQANLQRANLSHVRLEGADLTGADLRGTNLVGANLRDASTDGTILDEKTDLTGADLDGTTLATSTRSPAAQ